ncbi:MAG: hypothetical protein ACP5N6_03740, partial [Anaerolineae bacterium]
MLTPGTIRHNRYRIARLLGKGGMGAVYRAWDLRLNVPVAIKEMVPQPGIDPHTLTQLRQQFYQEAQVLEWARQLLDALAYCHSQGVLHRDINVFSLHRFFSPNEVAQIDADCRTAR